ncbi:hypothetical protein [Nocardiopsis synnemataformans]|uniref:hypothetical protein n=1 Tax=Nocardiopsis synnemataformans TaxID=61305 RepID=UPI003EB6A195
MRDPLPAAVTCPECKSIRKVTLAGAIYKHKAPKAEGAKLALPCPGSGTLVGSARIPSRVKGFYRCTTTGRRLRSVTTILHGGNPNPALAPWSAGRALDEAFDSLEEMEAVKGFPELRTEVRHRLRGAAVRYRDEKADLGSKVHTVVECYILGTALPAEIAEDPEMAPYLVAFERFVAEWEIEFYASEMTVANYRDNYAGTLDFLFRSPVLARMWGLPLLTLFPGDTKTGGTTLNDRTYAGHIRGVYPEAACQLSAYRNAEYGWMPDGTWVPMPATHDVGIILHLRPEGYQVVPARCDETVYQWFRSCQAVCEANAQLSPSVLGDPLTLPLPAHQEVAAA